jgi:FtsH-binding integral membrane protein
MSTFFPTQADVQREQARFITKVFGWMSVALAITGAMAMYTATSESLLSFVFGSKITFFGLIILELVLVGFLSARIRRMNASTATAIFVGYSLLNGLTLSSIFLVYTSSSIATTFFITAGTFAVFALVGYTTKTDLTRLGSLLFMAVIGIIIASVVNMFLGSSQLDYIISFVGVLVFTGLVAYDTQKIKEMNIIGNEGTDEDRKEAIMGALTLYLDFINLFIFLLRLFGDRK